MNSTVTATTFFALREIRDLASSVCRAAGMSLAPLEEQEFEGGEFKLRPLESVRDRTAFVLQCLAGTAAAPVAERMLKLLLLLHGLRDAGAGRRIALLPYLTFTRQDRRTQLRDPINTRYIAQLLESAGVDRIVTLDVHNTAALDNSFRIPVDHLSAAPMMVHHFSTRLPAGKPTVVSPDVGGIKRAQIFRELLVSRIEQEVDLAFFEKRRAASAPSAHTLVGEVKDRTVILVDDLCATGNTLMRAAEVCKRAGAAAVYVAVTHTPLSSGLAAVLADININGVVTTDSVGFHCGPSALAAAEKLTVLSIAPLFGHAVERLSSGKPIAPLLELWPLEGEIEAPRR